MRTLITGGTGFLGGHVTQLLRDIGEYPIPVNSMDADLTKEDDTRDLFSETKPDVVYHLAADVGGIQANMESPGGYWYNNLIMGMHILEYCRQHKVKKLIMVGTVCSYPKHACPPFTEEQLWEGYPEETNAPYGIAKKSLLVGAQAYREQFGLNTIFLIPANLYGPGDNFSGDGGHVIADMIHKYYMNDKSVTFWGDGSATRDFLYVEDAATGLIQAAGYYNGSWPVNLSSGKQINIRELSYLLKPLCGFRGKVLWDHGMPNGQPERWVDNSRAKALFGWEPRTPLITGLTNTARWYRKNVLTASDKSDKVGV